MAGGSGHAKGRAPGCGSLLRKCPGEGKKKRKRKEKKEGKRRTRSGVLGRGVPTTVSWHVFRFLTPITKRKGEEKEGRGEGQGVETWEEVKFGSE